MSTMQVRVLSGPDSVRAAAEIERANVRKDTWPYDWVYPPRNSQDVRASASIASPLPATQTEVLAYTVPPGFMFYLVALVQIYTGSGFVPGSGDITWVVDVNRAVGTSFPGNPVRWFGSDVVPLGSLVIPWPLARAEVFYPNDVLRSKVTTTAAIPDGVPNYFTSMFLGWIVPNEKR